MTSTLLFVDGHPVSYIIEAEGDHIVLYPRYDSHPDVEPPRLTAWRQGSQWMVEGTACRDLVDQVAEDLENLTPPAPKGEYPGTRSNRKSISH